MPQVCAMYAMAATTQYLHGNLSRLRIDSSSSTSSSSSGEAESPQMHGQASLQLTDLQEFIKDYVAGTAGSTVAIDNKIEQAMDLVKSHLMYAVREEVEVLKERIAELLDRISVLETENSILKAAAPQEVLAELPTALEDHHYNSQSSPAPPHQGPPSSTNN